MLSSCWWILNIFNYRNLIYFKLFLCYQQTYIHYTHCVIVLIVIDKFLKLHTSSSISEPNSLTSNPGRTKDSAYVLQALASLAHRCCFSIWSNAFLVICCHMNSSNMRLLRSLTQIYVFYTRKSIFKWQKPPAHFRLLHHYT